MSEPKRIELTLLGQSLTVRTEASADYIRSLARYLEKRVETLKRSGAPDSTRALLLAALDITDELFRAREDQDRLPGDVSERLGVMVAQLERAMPRDRV
jgi:cell division protein ZapA (FtsZ GTPase activity inhibitor)